MRLSVQSAESALRPGALQITVQHPKELDSRRGGERIQLSSHDTLDLSCGANGQGRQNCFQRPVDLYFIESLILAGDSGGVSLPRSRVK